MSRAQLVARLVVAAVLASTALALTATPATAGVADLKVTNVTLGSASVVRGKSLRLTDVTKNVGSSAARASVTKYYLSTDRMRSAKDVVLGKRKVRRLPDGHRDKGSKNVTIPVGTAARTFYVLACADATKKVREKSEHNNCRASGPLRVTRPVTSAGSTFPQTPSPIRVTTTTGTGTDNPAYPGFDVTGGQPLDVTTTGPDGTTYELSAPAGAVPQWMGVKLTPVTQVTGAPGTFVAGVRLTSYTGGAMQTGAALDKIATLTITPAHAVASRSAVTGFRIADHVVTGTTTQEFGLYPVSSSGAITVRFNQLSTYGVVTATDAQRATALAHPPSSTLAQVQNVLGDTTHVPTFAARRLARAATYPSSAAAANAYWIGVIKPALDNAKVNDSTAPDAVQAALSFLHFYEVLGAGEPSWSPDAVTAITSILSHEKQVAYTDCVQDHTMINLVKLLMVSRQFLLLGLEPDGDDAYDKFLKCAHFTVEITDHQTQSIDYPQEGPAAGWTMNYDFHVTSDVAPLELDSTFHFTGTSTLTEQVTGSSVTSHTCESVPGSYSDTDHLTPSATGAVPVTLYYDLNANYGLVNDTLILKPPVGSITAPLSFNNGPRETVTTDQVRCGGGTSTFSYEDTKWGGGFNQAQYPSYVTILPTDATGPDGATMKDWTPPIYDHGDGTRDGGVHEVDTYEVKIIHVPQ